ncbi:MAG: GDP-mannose 4,6-dehydratase [Bacteriovorax sp. MedPE-SWde]|nr:MAG: GDP-mannose 4,6-dehydratase [Bacteriovorax sp. MedPE-SWde]
MKTAFITGITGQDGYYLTELLLEKGYKVYGMIRRGSLPTTDRLKPFFDNPNLVLKNGDLADSAVITRLIGEIQPDEIYNLGAMSHVGISFEIPEYTVDVDGTGTLRILEAIRHNGLEAKTKFYQASTSELYGRIQETPQTEKTPFYPRSPYGAAKMYAYWITVNYRESYNIFACNGILFNHESPMRGLGFVTRKITNTVVKIVLGKETQLKIGNLDASRDWGYAKEYVEGMWRMLQVDEPQDYVLATGVTQTVRSFVESAFKHAGITIEWKGEKGTVDEFGICTETGKTLVVVDPQFFRPAEVELLIGDATKAKEDLGWSPKVNCEELVGIMYNADLEYEKKRG